MRTLALLCVCACADVTVMSYRPSTNTTGPSAVGHGRSFVARPPIGQVVAAVLSDGFPVWVVPHTDGTITVVSGVAPPPPRNGPVTRNDLAAQVDQTLVSWLPGARRFYANGIAFDERGHALGYTAVDLCLDECPRVEKLPQLLDDLDTFAVTFDSTTIEVGEIVEGKPRRRAETWIPWGATRDQDIRVVGTPAIPRLSLKASVALADGHYAIVDGQTVRSTKARPVICESTNGTCGRCGTDRLQLDGIVASDAAHVHSDGWWKDPMDYRRSLRQAYVEAQMGTFLVQRQGAGFQIVAGIFRGICSGSW